MLAEALAVANGDPRFIGYLSGNAYNRGFPEYVRDFNTAFLALPALPTRRLTDASTDPEVVVRMTDSTTNGTWLAVVNTGLASKENVVLKLPVTGAMTDAVTGTPVTAQEGKLSLTLRPCQLRALIIKP